MKYNFKGSYKLAITLLLILLLFVGIVKNLLISKGNDISYYDNDIKCINLKAGKICMLF